MIVASSFGDYQLCLAIENATPLPRVRCEKPKQQLADAMIGAHDVTNRNRSVWQLSPKINYLSALYQPQLLIASVSWFFFGGKRFWYRQHYCQLMLCRGCCQYKVWRLSALVTSGALTFTPLLTFRWPLTRHIWACRLALATA